MNISKNIIEKYRQKILIKSLTKINEIIIKNYTKKYQNKKWHNRIMDYTDIDMTNAELLLDNIINMYFGS